MSFETLVKELFIGDIETMRSHLKSIPEKERSTLYKQVTPLIQVLYQTLLDDRTKDLKNYCIDGIKNYDLALIYQWYQTDANEFLKQDWINKVAYFDNILPLDTEVIRYLPNDQNKDLVIDQNK